MAIPEAILEKLRQNDPDVIGLSLSMEVESDTDVVRLVNALKNNTYFRTLTIQGLFHDPGIGDESARLLSTCENLVFLDISDNRNITDRGAAAFANHPSLETLFMRGCRVTPAGLIPFLNNDVITDLRIANTAAHEAQVGVSVKLKLKDNASFTLEQKLARLTVEQLNLKLSQFIHCSHSCIPKLPSALQVDAKTHPREWNATTGLVLSRNIALIKGEDMARIAASAQIFAERYRELWQDAEQSKKQKVESEELSPSLSPSI